MGNGLVRVSGLENDAMKIHDVSLPIHPNMLVWPTDEKPRFGAWLDLARGDVANATGISISAHAGTHMDAPCHMIAGAASIDQTDLSILIGPALLVDTGEAPVITAALLDTLGIPAGTTRVIFRTLNTRTGALEKPFNEAYVGLSRDAGQWLVDRGVRLVGTDYLSVGTAAENIDTHVILLRAGVVLLETLDLRAVAPGPYQLIALPLKFLGLDGSPARAVLIEP